MQEEHGDSRMCHYSHSLKHQIKAAPQDERSQRNSLAPRHPLVPTPSSRRNLLSLPSLLQQFHMKTRNPINLDLGPIKGTFLALSVKQLPNPHRSSGYAEHIAHQTDESHEQQQLPGPRQSSAGESFHYHEPAQ